MCILSSIFSDDLRAVIEVEQEVIRIDTHGQRREAQEIQQLPQDIELRPLSTQPIEVHHEFRGFDLLELYEFLKKLRIPFGGMFLLGEDLPDEVPIIWTNAFFQENGIQEEVVSQRLRIHDALIRMKRQYAVYTLVERVLGIFRALQ